MSPRNRWSHIWHVGSSFVLLFAVWECVSLIGAVPDVLLPSPIAVASRAWQLSVTGELLRHTAASLARLAVGFAIGGAAGILVGIAIGEVQVARYWLKPVIDFMQSIPTVAWIPVIIIWFGLGITSTIVIMSLGVFWPVVVNTDAGVRAVSPNMILLARSLGASRLSAIVRVLVPAALPQILAGVRVGMSRGWRGLIIAETFAGTSAGIGTMIFAGREYFRMEDILLGVLVIGCLSLAMERSLFERLERLTIGKWGMARMTV